MELVPRYKKLFTIKSNTQSLPFKYERTKEGFYTTTADDILLDAAEDNELIEVVDWKISNAPVVFKGRPEPIHNNGIQILQPSADGSTLEEAPIGSFKCVRCGHINIVNQEEGKFTSPFECQSDACGRRGPFKTLFPKDLLRPVWKLPVGALECSAVGVYERVFNFIKTYLVINPHEYHLTTLWIMASYLVDDFKTVPYLMFIAPKESGKSQAMRVLNQLAYRAFLAASITPAALFRSIELWRITLLVDEAEFQIKTDTESGQALYQVLNMGYKQDSFAIRTEGVDRIPTPFNVFGFKAIASTRVFLPTLESRSIVVHMAQARPPKIMIDDNEADLIRSELLYFRFRYLENLPIIQPDSVSGRIIEIMTPLFTVSQIFKDLKGMVSFISFEQLTTILNDQIKYMEDIRREEEDESVEALVLEAIQKIQNDPYRVEPEGACGGILLKEISRALNWIDDRDVSISRQTTLQSTKRIKKILWTMGIRCHRISKGNVLYHTRPEEADRIKEMVVRYLSLQKPV